MNKNVKNGKKRLKKQIFFVIINLSFRERELLLMTNRGERNLG